MPARPALSVVLSTQEAGGLLDEALGAVRAQSLVDVEILVVDDPTSGAALEPVAAAATADGRVRLVRSEGSPRDAGIDAARGRRIAFCRDGAVPPGAYAALVGSLERSGSDAAIAGAHEATGTTLQRTPELVAHRTCALAVFDLDWLRGIRVRGAGAIVATLSALVSAGRIDVVEGLDHPCAPHEAPLADYLREERLCAKLVGDLGDLGAPALARAYGGHVRENEVFPRIARFAEAGADDDDVRSALRALLDVLPEDEENGDPLRALVIGLVARRRTAAARPLARWLLGDDDDPAAQVRDWSQALAPMEDAELLWPEVRAELAPPITSALRARMPVDDAASWRALVDETRRALTDHALVLVPEAATHPVLASRVLAARALADGCVTSVSRERRTVVVEGRSAVGGDRALPVLHDGEGLGEVQAASIDWTPERGGWRWTAVYPLRSLPIERTLTPALAISLEGFAVAIDGEGELPPLDRRHPLVCGRLDGVTTLRRRPHWMVRGARRAADAVRMWAVSVRKATGELRDRVLVR